MIVASGARGLGSVKPVLDWPPVQAHAGIRKASGRPVALLVSTRVRWQTECYKCQTVPCLIPDPFPLLRKPVGGTTDVWTCLNATFSSRQAQERPVLVPSSSFFVHSRWYAFVQPVGTYHGSPPPAPLFTTEQIYIAAAKLAHLFVNAERHVFFLHRAGKRVPRGREPCHGAVSGRLWRLEIVGHPGDAMFHGQDPREPRKRRGEVR